MNDSKISFGLILSSASGAVTFARIPIVERLSRRAIDTQTGLAVLTTSCLLTVLSMRVWWRNARPLYLAAVIIMFFAGMVVAGVFLPAD